MKRRCIDLSQTFYEGMPHPRSLPPPQIAKLQRSEQYKTHVTQFTFTTHIGTHVDAPLHFIPSGKTIDAFSLDTFAGEAVVFDCPKKKYEAITVADCAGAGLDVRPGDIVFFHTTWGAKFGTDAYYEHPFLDIATARWLVNRHVKMVGVDFISVDLPESLRKAGFDFPVHNLLLGRDVLIVEHLNLGGVAGQRVDVAAFPLKIKDADGAPARVVAFVNA